MAWNEDEAHFIKIEMDKSAYMIRFQNVLEDKEEDLEGITAEVLAPEMDMDSAEIQKEINFILRVNSSYARKSKLPREVHAKFPKKNNETKFSGLWETGSWR